MSDLVKLLEGVIPEMTDKALDNLRTAVGKERYSRQSRKDEARRERRVQCVRELKERKLLHSRFNVIIPLTVTCLVQFKKEKVEITVIPPTAREVESELRQSEEYKHQVELENVRRNEAVEVIHSLGLTPDNHLLKGDPRGP